MSAELPRELSDALPEHLRGRVRVERREPGRLALRFDGVVIDVWLAVATPRAYLSLGPLSFGYRVDGDVDAEAARARCDELARVLAERATEPLLAELDAAAPEIEAMSSPRATMMLTEGDVLRGRRLAALARAREVESVELYLHGAVCEQSCGFCAYPRVRARRATPAAKLGAGLRVVGQRLTGAPETLDWLAAVLAIMRERPNARVILSGPDCLRHPQIDDMLELLGRETRLGVELLGPLTRLAEPELFERVAAIPGLRSICTSLLSTRADVHDAMVGRAGAHAQVLQALANCRARGVPFSLNVLVGPANVDDLPALLELCAALGAADVNVTLYHPESAVEVLVRASWRELHLPALVVEREPLLRAWAAVSTHALARVHAHYLPRCWVPAALRERLLRAPRDRQDNFAYLPACARCAERERCPGVTVPAAELLGERAVEQI